MLASPAKPAKKASSASCSIAPPSIAPPTADVRSVITGDGRIYHPCHGHSFRAVSIFDLFPGIVKYQSKRFTERDRVDFLISHSASSFLVQVDEAAMWLTALKYLLNDAVLRPLDHLTAEMQFVLREYMSSHRKRLQLLRSIRAHGFLHVLGSLHQKVPRATGDIRRKMRKAEQQRLRRLQQLQQLQQHRARKAYEAQLAAAHSAFYGHAPHSAFYGYSQAPPQQQPLPDAWELVTEMVNESKAAQAQAQHTEPTQAKQGQPEDDESQETVDVYQVIFEAMTVQGQQGQQGHAEAGE